MATYGFPKGTVHLLGQFNIRGWVIIGNIAKRCTVPFGILLGLGLILRFTWTAVSRKNRSTMEKVKSTKEHTIFKKNSGRYAVQNAKGEYIKAADKTKILLDEKLIKLTPAKKKEEPVAEAAPTSETPAS